MMPEQKPGRSKQDYRTPPEFLDAMVKRLHVNHFSVDLAATEQNKVAGMHYGPGSTLGEDSLLQPWNLHGGWCWLNPPYADIRPWVEKAHDESLKGAKIAILIPASVGANWWADYVEKSCYQLFLNGRITFQGCTTPYPKDCALLLYTPFIRSGNAVWDWRN